MIVYCASTNPGKLREFNLIAAHYAVGHLEVIPVPGLKAIEPPEETGATFAENAILKAAYYSAFVNGLLFADDSGLAVDALNGAPGIYSARYAGAGATDAENNAYLLQALQCALAGPLDATAAPLDELSAANPAGRGAASPSLPETPLRAASRTARFVCAIAVASNGRLLETFEDSVEGQLLTEARGPNGFGYDPLFYYPPFNLTFGEASAESKLLVSHRGKAMEKMFRWINPAISRDAVLRNSSE